MTKPPGREHRLGMSVLGLSARMAEPEALDLGGKFVELLCRAGHAIASGVRNSTNAESQLRVTSIVRRVSVAREYRTVRPFSL